MTKLLFKTLAGSRLYGVATNTSDYDYKGIYIETLEELLYNKSEVSSRKSPEENSEFEDFSLKYYMTLLRQGQVIPMDMLFAPSNFWVESSEAWEQLQENRQYFISKNIMPFVGYAKGQAIKYGLKGSKLFTINTALSILEQTKDFTEICNKLKSFEGIEFHTEKTANRNIKHIKICGKSFGETTDTGLWKAPLESLKESFGKRAEDAISGIDLKAMYHTVRICNEAVELLTTGNITFPRPEADLLVSIRSGKLSKDTLETLIEENFAKVKHAEIVSTLSLEPDKEKMKQLTVAIYKKYL